MTANSDTKTQHGAEGALGIALAHRKLQQVERRKHRERERTRLLVLSSSAHDNDSTRWRHGELQVDDQARELALAQAVTARRGFVTQQLTAPTLSPLERWYHQLQLLMWDEAQSYSTGRNSDLIVDEEENEEADHATALSALEGVLAQDVACLDLRYAASASVQDVAKCLLDNEGAFVPQSSLLPEEILSFSTVRSGRVCRVTCVRHASSNSPVDRQYAFDSSLFIRDFETKATQLLLLPATHARSLIEFVWSELSPP